MSLNHNMNHKDAGLFLRLLNPLDERVNTKLLMRVWGPRVEFVVRLILVATFLDDSFRTATDFTDHVAQVGEQGCLKWLATTEPELVKTIAIVALGAGLLAQSIGSLSLLALFCPGSAANALIGWAIAQPILYAQLANIGFVSESLSLVGGLLMLRAHLISEQAKRAENDDSAARAAIARTQLLGRLLLPTAYLYHAGLLLVSLFTPETTESYGMFAKSLSMFAVNAAVLLGLVLGCSLVAAGLKSRTVALSLALLNLAFVCYQFPFFRFVWFEGGAWKYDEVGMRNAMPHVALPPDVSPGALLLLAQYGPGEMAVEDEGPLLPVVERAD